MLDVMVRCRIVHYGLNSYGYYTATDLHISVTVTTATSFLMRLAKFPVDRTPSTLGTERERERAREYDGWMKKRRRAA